MTGFYVNGVEGGIIVLMTLRYLMRDEDEDENDGVYRTLAGPKWWERIEAKIYDIYLWPRVVKRLLWHWHEFHNR